MKMEKKVKMKIPTEYKITGATIRKGDKFYDLSVPKEMVIITEDTNLKSIFKAIACSKGSKICL